MPTRMTPGVSIWCATCRSSYSLAVALDPAAADDLVQETISRALADPAKDTIRTLSAGLEHVCLAPHDGGIDPASRLSLAREIGEGADTWVVSPGTHVSAAHRLPGQPVAAGWRTLDRWRANRDPPPGSPLLTTSHAATAEPVR